MTLSNLPRPVLGLLAVTPVALVVTAIFTAIPWLKSLPDNLVYAITAIAAVFVIGWSLFISILVQKNQDEVQRASERFGLQYGFIGGTIAVALLLVIPGVTDFIIDASNAIAVSLKGSDDKAPILAFVGGMAALSIAQSIGALIASQAWWRSKS